MKSKNIIITGTSRGIGFELVHLFAKQGHNVLALSRKEQPVNNIHLHLIYARKKIIKKSRRLFKTSGNMLIF
jgi:NAD(P)-dependent dehydrogenase (short-subunit alcohol dehydrogenase family)